MDRRLVETIQCRNCNKLQEVHVRLLIIRRPCALKLFLGCRLPTSVSSAPSYLVKPTSVNTADCLMTKINSSFIVNSVPSAGDTSMPHVSTC